MTYRKKIIRIAQTSFLIIGLIIIFFTYFNKKKTMDKEVNIPQQMINEQILNSDTNEDIFLDIEYSGIDLSGNRYILKSKEAYNDKSLENIINMKGVTSNFYFKDDTTLIITSDRGQYNNKTLDMVFIGNIKAIYQGSELYAERAEYYNGQNFLIVSEDVKIVDFRGTMNADKLIVDITKQKMEISSLNNKKINANMNVK